MNYKGFDLTGRVAVVTGSTSGMGLAIARGLAQCGAQVVVSSHLQSDTDSAASLLASEGFDVKGIPCDITNLDNVRIFSEESKRAFGHVDIVVCHAAGRSRSGQLPKPILIYWTLCSSQQCRNNLVLIRQFLPEMAERRLRGAFS
ncbi:SDR family NAD(P)-dependent oxidoreductase [Cupriavidus basilensis]